MTTMINPNLEYKKVVWSSHKKQIEELEIVQRIAPKLVPELKVLAYEGRLRKMQLMTVDEREKDRT